MVGDDVEADVNGALAVGMRALLVRTEANMPALSRAAVTAAMPAMARIPMITNSFFIEESPCSGWGP